VAESSFPTAQEKPQEGEVVAVVSGARDEAGKLIPTDLKAGVRVLFGKWSDRALECRSFNRRSLAGIPVSGVYCLLTSVTVFAARYEP